MPWSPKSVLAGHQRPGIRPFSFQEVMDFVPHLRLYLRNPHRQHNRRAVFSRLASMFSRSQSSIELRSIVATLSQISLFHDDYAVRVFDVLDELRLVMNEDERSPEASDYEH